MRTTVNIDDNLLQEARRALGTKGLTETVNRALASAARQVALKGFDVRTFDITEIDLAASRVDRLS